IKIVELIVFNLGDEEFAADIEQVREIIRRGTITPIPDSPDFIKGVTNVRGEITVVIDLKARFFLPLKREVESKHIVITEQEKNLYGLMVDEVSEVLRIPEKEIKSTPELVTRIDRVYMSGVITLENRLVILIDLAKVLSEEELAKLAEFAQKHRPTREARQRETKAEEAVEAQITQRETEESAEVKISDSPDEKKEEAVPKK
ncbi:MAG: chemotaxis protein CheW, partial [bacterium]